MVRHWVMAFLYPRPIVGALFLPRYLSHWLKYKRAGGGMRVSIADLQPCLGDWTSHTPFDTHYFYQGAWLARKVAALSPSKHVDIGSSVMTMSVISATTPTLFVDYRPLKAELPGLTSVGGDILNLEFETGSINSLSCLHVIEHIGLGRYGDPIDPMGSVKAATELQRVVCPGGSLFLSLPVGRERVCFNAHRVHAPATVLGMFPQMKLVDFSYVDDKGQFHPGQQIDAAAHQEYGCGMFHFEKQVTAT